MEFFFILVEPAVPENVGASARAMNTMGFTNLRLVNSDLHLHKNAGILAHGSKEILYSAETFDCITKAVSDLDFIVSTSAKNRSIKVDYSDSSQLFSFLQKKGSTINSVGILFGREESGLTNEEISISDHVIQIPMETTYPSLNLSQAVMIVAYDLYKGLLHSNYKAKKKKQHTDTLHFKKLQSRVKLILEKINMTRNEVIANRIIERFNQIGEEDINLLHSVCSQLEKKLDITR